MGQCDLPQVFYCIAKFSQITLDDFVRFATTNLKPDFFIWLGDNSDHAIWNHTKEEYNDPTKHISKMLQDYNYSNIGSVYPALGNHEGFPCDIFDFESDSHKWIINETAESWKPWLTPEALNTYLKLGSYSMLHPGTKMRIVSVNTLVYDTMNSFLWKNNTDPWGVVKNNQLFYLAQMATRNIGK